MRDVFSGVACVVLVFGCVGLYILAILLAFLAFCALYPYVGLWSLLVLAPACLASAAAMFKGMDRAMDFSARLLL